MSHFRWMSILAGVAPWGCSGPTAGTETGNAAVPVDIRLSLLTASPAEPPRATDAAGVEFTFAEARASVRRIDFDLPAGLTCADVADQVEGGRCEPEGTSGRIRFEGPWVVDLVRGTSTPSMDGLAIPAGTYRRVDIRLDEAEHLDGGDPLADRTLVGEGSFAGDGGPRDFVLRLAFHEDARFEGGGGVVVGEGGPAQFVLALDPAAWFADVPLSTCASRGELPLEGGRVVIGGEDDGDGACSDVEDSVERRVKASGRLDDDADDD